MQLLSSSGSTLAEFYYQQLLSLAQAEVAAGGLPLSNTGLASLVQAAQDFLSLTVPESGQIARADAFNYPLALLQARLDAMSAEQLAFLTRIGGYLALLDKETGLLDQLLAGAELERWKATQHQLDATPAIAWDFRIGAGLLSPDIDPTDPNNGVAYPSVIAIGNQYALDRSQQTGGFVPEALGIPVPIKGLSWITTGTSAQEALVGQDWAQLSLLEDQPLVDFTAAPSVALELPLGGSINGIFSVSGQVAGGALPILVSTGFTPRRSTLIVSNSNACPDRTGSLGSWTLNGWVVSSGLERSVGAAGPLLGAPLSSPVASGDKIYVRVTSDNTAGTTGTLSVYLSCLDHTGAEVAVAPVSLLFPIVGSQLGQSVVTIPSISTIASARVKVVAANHTAGSWWIRDVLVHQPQTLSAYPVPQDEVAVYLTKADGVTALTVYQPALDYVVDSIGRVTLMELSAASYSIRFTENYPSYQCSIDGTVWSPLLMLDPARPYPDLATSYESIAWGLDPQGKPTLFPLTDEVGEPLGLYLQQLAPPQFEYRFTVSTPAGPVYGATAMLEVELSRTAYLSAFALDSFTNLPATLKTVELEGLTAATRVSIWSGDLLLDRPFQLTFPRQMVRKLHLGFAQENYDWKTYAVDPADRLRRDTLAALQSVLPFATRILSPAELNFYTGAEYDFGFENLRAYDLAYALPEVLVSGPYRVTGVPDIVLLTQESSGTVSTYLCFRAYTTQGLEIDVQLQGVILTPGVPQVFPFATLLNRATVGYVDVSVKFVLRNQAASVGKWMLEMSVT